MSVMSIPAPKRVVKTRRVKFDYTPATVERHYAQGDLIMSHVVAILSAMFPEGEDFFVRSVRYYADRITDPDLKEARAQKEIVDIKQRLADGLAWSRNRQGLTPVCLPDPLIKQHGVKKKAKLPCKVDTFNYKGCSLLYRKAWVKALPHLGDCLDSLGETKFEENAEQDD